MNSKTDKEDTQENSPKNQPTPIVEQVMLTFDSMRKINNTIKEHDLLLMFEGNEQVLDRMIAVFNFYNESYTVGSMICNHYIKQREQVLILKAENEQLKAENENLKANIK